ncbi:MAG TPA: alkaline phosphatase PhoX [Candidatus Eisenbacteria bacterium]|nr:alkaline phosphatase PhoX [Candidatus Eisenbacteria bacterium]
MIRRAAASLLALAALGAATLAPEPAAAALRPTLRPWPGPGFRTPDHPYVRPLRDDVTFHPLMTVGDTLVPPDVDEEGFVFYPLPDGIGLQLVDEGLAEIYVAHEIAWDDGLGGGRVSRLLVDPRSERILAADWIVDGIEQFDRLCGASLAGARQGFLSPRLLINEESILGPNRGIVAAVDPRSGTVTGLPWLGRFEHERTVVLPAVSGQLVTLLTEDGPAGQSQLYMYLANGDNEILEGRGRLYVLRADAPAGRENTQLASMARKVRPLTGRFVPVRGVTVDGDASHPSAIELAAQGARALNFVRLEGVTPDTRNANAFFIADTGQENVIDPVSGQPVTGGGRIYRIELDAFDPTVVKEIRVLLDADEGDDLYRPDNIAADDRGLLIQEDPGRRGLHPARILRYDFRSLRLEPIAECVERDPQGRVIPEGTGGAWETTGITDASEVFGPGSWLIAVQAHTMRETFFRGRAGGGQLLLMRTGVRRAETKKAAAEGGEEDRGGEADEPEN